MCFPWSCWTVTKIKPIKVWASGLFQGQECFLHIICVCKGQRYDLWRGAKVNNWMQMWCKCGQLSIFSRQELLWLRVWGMQMMVHMLWGHLRVESEQIKNNMAFFSLCTSRAPLWLWDGTSHPLRQGQVFTCWRPQAPLTGPAGKHVSNCNLTADDFTHVFH